MKFAKRHLVVLLLALAASRAEAQSLSGAALLPGDLAVAPAAGDQLVPALCRGGNQVLAVWQDNRTNLGTNLVTVQGGADIYAARLDAAGVLIDTLPIVVNQDSGNQTQPRVAWNGSEWLVAFNADVPFFASATTGIQCVRVAADGAVLDPVPLTIPGTATGNSEFWSVASDGNQFVVVWKDYVNSTATWSAFARRIGADGTLLDAAPVTLLANIAVQPYRGAMAFAGDEYLLAWEEYSSGTSDWNVRGRRFNAALAGLGAAKTIASDADNDVDTAVAANGTDFYVTWERYNNCCGLGGQVRGTRVNHAGTVLDGAAGVAIYNSPDEITTGRASSVAWDGTQWVVGFARSFVGFQQSVFAARVGADGAVLDPNGVLMEAATDNQGNSAAAELPGGGALLAWDTVSAGGATPWDVRAAALAGTAQPLGALALGAPTQTAADAVDAGDVTAVAFLSAISGRQRVLLSRVDAAGTPLDAEPVEVAAYAPSLASPHVAWNGSTYLVTWDSASGVLGRRYSAKLQALDATPIVVAPTGHVSDIAALGDTFMVAYLASPTFETSFVYTRRVSGETGATLDPAGVVVGGSHAGSSSITAFAGGFVVAWQSHFTHDDPHADVQLVFVSAQNVPGLTLNATNAYLFHRAPRLAASDDTLLVTWHQELNGADMRVLGRRVSPAGAFLGPAFVIDDALFEQQASAVAWTGSSFAVGWEDHRSETWLVDARSDVFGARVAADGTVADPSGFAVADGAPPQFAAAVAGGQGSATYAWSGFESGAPYAGYRIAVRVLDPAVTFTDVGLGLAGTHGVPKLAGTGTLQVGTPVALLLTSAKESSTAALIVGLSAANLPLKGGTLVPAPDLLVTGLTTNAVGALALGGTWPAGVPSGLSFWSQIWIADVAASQGFAASNGLKASVP